MVDPVSTEKSLEIIHNEAVSLKKSLAANPNKRDISQAVEVLGKRLSDIKLTSTDSPKLAERALQIKLEIEILSSTLQDDTVVGSNSNVLSGVAAAADKLKAAQKKTGWFTQWFTPSFAKRVQIASQAMTKAKPIEPPKNLTPKAMDRLKAKGRQLEIQKVAFGKVFSPELLSILAARDDIHALTSKMDQSNAIAQLNDAHQKFEAATITLALMAGAGRDTPAFAMAKHTLDAARAELQSKVVKVDKAHQAVANALRSGGLISEEFQRSNMKIIGEVLTKTLIEKSLFGVSIPTFEGQWIKLDWNRQTQLLQDPIFKQLYARHEVQEQLQAEQLKVNTVAVKESSIPVLSSYLNFSFAKELITPSDDSRRKLASLWNPLNQETRDNLITNESLRELYKLAVGSPKVQASQAEISDEESVVISDERRDAVAWHFRDPPDDSATSIAIEMTSAPSQPQFVPPSVEEPPIPVAMPAEPPNAKRPKPLVRAETLGQQITQRKPLNRRWQTLKSLLSLTKSEPESDLSIDGPIIQLSTEQLEVIRVGDFKRKIDYFLAKLGANTITADGAPVQNIAAFGQLGIFRVPAKEEDLSALRDAIAIAVPSEEYDLLTLAAGLKEVIRDLRPFSGENLQEPAWVETSPEIKDRVYQLLVFLNRIAAASENGSLMTAENLAVVFAPNFFKEPEGMDGAAQMTFATDSKAAVRAMIEHPERFAPSGEIEDII